MRPGGQAFEPKLPNARPKVPSELPNYPHPTMQFRHRALGLGALLRTSETSSKEVQGLGKS